MMTATTFSRENDAGLLERTSYLVMRKSRPQLARSCSRLIESKASILY